MKPCQSNQIHQSARPFTVSEKTRLGNGDADDADDDDDSKRHFCVYVFVCVYSENLIHTGTCVGQTGTDRDGRAADAAERDGRRRQGDEERCGDLDDVRRRDARARAIGGRLEPSSPMGGRVARGSDSRGKILTRHRAARGAHERRAPRAAATIEFYDFFFRDSCVASEPRVGGARRADGGELD